MRAGISHKHGGGRGRRLAGELERSVLVLDGAMGTQIQSLGLTEADFRGTRYAGHERALQGNFDVLCLTRPDTIKDLHLSYLEAGADIISTNTFGANPVVQGDYGTAGKVYEMNLAAARLAAEAVAEFNRGRPGRPRFVAGAIGPTNKSCSIATDPEEPARRETDFDTLAAAYREQVSALAAGGVDVFLLETVFDTLNAKAALFAIESALAELKVDIPVWISATIADRRGRILSGQTIEAFWISVAHARPLCVGLNCGLGPGDIRPHLASLGAVAGAFVSAHPNAGLPDEAGRYSETPEGMAAAMEKLAREGLLNVAGGCCGTTPDHTRAIAEAVAGIAPRAVLSIPRRSRLSGLEPVEIGPGSLFVNIGERTNVTGSARFARLIREGRGEKALAVAREQIRAGAQIIDVNMDDPLMDSRDEMVKFLNLAASDPEVAKVPVMVDSARWEVLEAGLKCLQGKGIANSISLKDGEEELVRRARLARSFGAAVVVMAFDERGQAESYERKVEICTRAYRILTERAGVSAEDVILDPAVFAVGTGLSRRDDRAVAFIEACRALKSNLPHCMVSGGVSNLSFAFRGLDALREAMHTVFLYHSVRAGLDMGIVNAGQLGVYESIPAEIRDPVEDLILDRDENALARVLELAARMRGAKGEERKDPEEARRKAPVQDRLKRALLEGAADHVEEDAVAAMEALGTALAVVEDLLMSGMEEVGAQFAEGKMFLPQVIRSARVMKKAVAALEPYMKEAGERSPARRKGKVLLATVQGDVHDIGKNIVGVVLACNGFEVVDLGTNVSAPEIVEAVRTEAPDAVGLSGLITPSLDKMAQAADELNRAGLAPPLLVGGAATSKAHAATKIDPLYGGAVLHVSDASRAASAAERAVRADAGALEKIKAEHARIRSEALERRAGAKLLDLEDARGRSLSPDWSEYSPPRPVRTGVSVIDDYPLSDLPPYFDWSQFLKVWKMKGAGGRSRRPDRLEEDARELVAEAKALLSRVIGDRMLSGRAVVGLFPANSSGDDVEIYLDEDRSSLLATAHFLRQQGAAAPERPKLCLSDFIGPKGSGVEDYIGVFVVSAGFGCDESVRRLRAEGDDYQAIMLQALADGLADAAAEHLHLRVRRELWGYAEDEAIGPEGAIAGKYRGIRPAPGYPACPDHAAKGLICDILDARRGIAVDLTDTFDMVPAASVAGWYFAHPEARYFKVGRIGRDQLEDYARREGITAAEAKRRLVACL